MDLHTIPIKSEFFTQRDSTLVTWLGMAGAMINARGAILLIDPLLSAWEEDGRLRSETGYWLSVPPPVYAQDIPRADVVMYTHADEDHVGKETARTLAKLTGVLFLAPPPVIEVLIEAGITPEQCITARDWEIHKFGEAEITITPALHDWQEVNPWQRGDCCGYLVQTKNGKVWHPGDTRLIDDLLTVKDVDVLFFDVASVPSHLGPQGSAQIARSSGAKTLIAYHYGTFDLPPGSFANCNPLEALPYVEGLNAELQILNPGDVIRV